MATVFEDLRATHAEIDELRQADLAAHAAHSAELAKARQVTGRLYDMYRRAQTQLDQYRFWQGTDSEAFARHLQTQLADQRALFHETLRRNREQYEEKRATHARNTATLSALIEELRTKLEAAEIADDGLTCVSRPAARWRAE